MIPTLKETEIDGVYTATLIGALANRTEIGYQFRCDKNYHIKKGMTENEISDYIKAGVLDIQNRFTEHSLISCLDIKPTLAPNLTAEDLLSMLNRFENINPKKDAKSH